MRKSQQNISLLLLLRWVFHIIAVLAVPVSSAFQGQVLVPDASIRGFNRRLLPMTANQVHTSKSNRVSLRLHQHRDGGGTTTSNRFGKGKAEEMRTRLQRSATAAFAAAALFLSVLGAPVTIDLTQGTATSPNPWHHPFSIELSNAHATPTATPLTERQQFVSNTWFAVTAQFFDPTYNGLGEDGWRTKKDEAVAAVAAAAVDSKNSSSEKERVDAAIRNMLASLGDPYTRYLPAEKYEAFTAYAKGGAAAGSVTAGNEAGIGAQLLMDRVGDVVIMNVAKDGPAAAGGVRVGDVVTEVDGASTEGATAEFVGRKCRGEPGSKVRLTVRRGSTVERLTLNRAIIELKNVETSTFVSEYSGQNLGLIRVSSFTQNTAAEIAGSMRDIAATNNDSNAASAIVIDLRGNVGGYMPAGIDAARLFLPKRAAIVAEFDRAGAGTFYFGNDSTIDTTTPLYLLVDGRTASAAEIFAAALKDNRRATVVGTTTFGKGRIQNVQSLEGGGGIVVTRGWYLTPAGRDIHGVGIRPNSRSETCGPEASASMCLSGLI